MGVPYLTTILQPYATSIRLVGQVVVIDGPSLAYHIYHLCNCDGVLVPTFELLGRTAVEWLDRLRGASAVV